VWKGGGAGAAARHGTRKVIRGRASADAESALRWRVFVAGPGAGVPRLRARTRRSQERRGEETDLLAPAVGFRSFYLVRYGTDGVGKVNLS